MKLETCLQCGRRYYRYSKQWRCPKCTAKWRDQKIQEREAAALAEQYSQVHAVRTPPPLAATPADVYAIQQAPTGPTQPAFVVENGPPAAGIDFKKEAHGE